MEDLGAIEANCEKLLRKYPNLAKNRKLAIWYYWKKFEGIAVGITKQKWLTLTSAETISRAIRRTQEKFPELRGETKEHELKFHNYYANKKET